MDRLARTDLQGQTCNGKLDPKDIGYELSYTYDLTNKQSKIEREE